jgi:hypothetical protein
MKFESAARIPCLLVVGACMHRSLTPPRPTAAKEDQAQAPPPPTLAERIIIQLSHMPYINLFNAIKVCLLVALPSRRLTAL